MTSEIDVNIEFEFAQADVPKGSPSWCFRCACGRGDCGDLVFGPYKTKREAPRAAEAFAQSVVEELSASVVDGGNAQH